MKRQKGFTLIVLMTAIGIGAVLLSVAVPGLQAITANSKQRSDVNELVSAFHLARNTAITTNNRVTVCASSNGESCESVAWSEGWIVFTDLNSDQTIDDNESLIRAGTGSIGVVIASSQFPQFLMYRPSGRVMNASTATNSGDFSVCDDRGSERAKVVSIELSGRPRVSHYLASGSSPSCS